MKEIAVTLIQVVGALGILGLSWKIFLYTRERKLRKMQAEKALAKTQIQVSEMFSRHSREYDNLDSEIRKREREYGRSLSFNADIAIDEGLEGFSSLRERHFRELGLLYADISYLEKILGHKSSFLSADEEKGIYKKLKRYVRYFEANEFIKRMRVKASTMIKQYIAYLKDNPEGYWFKRKIYGWGWTPATWQGWLVMFFFLGLIALNAVKSGLGSHSASDTLLTFLPRTFILVLLLIAVCWKTGEKPRWQWGLPDAYKKSDTDRFA